MWKLTLLIVMLTAGCAGTSRESFDVREKVSVVSNEAAEITIFEHSKGYGYWVPLQDVSRTVLTSFVVELERREKQTGTIASLRSNDLMQSPHADGTRFPGFLGASNEFGFWSAPTGFFVVDLATGKIREVSCDRRFLMPGSWEQVGAQGIRRKNVNGVFEFSPEGAKQVSGKPLP